ncbi:MAG: SnoaL-like domain [Pseudomonadota bacterium]|jgi:hypothetical protein
MTPASAPSNTDPKAGALGAVHAWMNAINRHDLDAVVATFAHDASFFGTSTQTLVNASDGIRDYFDVVLRNYAPLSAALGQITVSELSSSSAVVTGYDQWRLTIEGKQVESIGRLSIAIALRDGHWQIVSFHRSAIPA